MPTPRSLPALRSAARLLCVAAVALASSAAAAPGAPARPAPSPAPKSAPAKPTAAKHAVAKPAAGKPKAAKPALKPAAKPAAGKPGAAKPAPGKPAGGAAAGGTTKAGGLVISTQWRFKRNGQRRLRDSTRYIILHTTEGAARGALEKLSTNGECHYVVDTAGTVYQIVDRGRVAFHAGLSMWNGRPDLDSRSIGIEVVGWHNKPITDPQVDSLRKLLAQLKASYKITDDRVLTHSMVAFGNPNHWQKKKHRGRKRCGMQFADPVLRARLGLFSKPAFDPDLRAGRLFDADPELTRILYRRGSAPAAPAQKPAAPTVAGNRPSAAPATGAPARPSPAATPAAPPPSPATPADNVIGRRRSAWDIARDQYNAPTTTYRFPDGTVKRGSEISGREWRAMPAGTVVTLGEECDGPGDNANEGLLTIGEDGSAQNLAGDAVASGSTFYFPVGETYVPGSSLTLEQIDALPNGTKMLVGYKSGGPVSAKRPVGSICGSAWNSADTFYWDPVRKRILPGDDISERKIPKDAIVFWR